MIEVAPATEDDMIAAFVSAEIGSSRWDEKYIIPRLRRYNIPRSVIDEPNTRDEHENKMRRAVFADYRGYPNNLLFTGFPAGVTWRRVRLEPADFQRMRCAKEMTTLLPLSGPTRLITDAARNFSDGVPAAARMAQVTEIISAIKRGATFGPLIAAEDHDGSLILIEGHSRAIAYVIAGATGTGVEALVGTAATFKGWHFY